MSRSLSAFRWMGLTLAIGLLALPVAEAANDAEAPVELPHAAEDAAWKKIAARFTGEWQVRRDREGRLTEVRVDHYQHDPKDYGWVRVRLDPADGHVVAVASDRGAWTNEDMKLFAPFAELRSLTFWHSSNFHDRDLPRDRFDGSGFEHLRHLAQLEEVTHAGSAFDDDGLAAVAKLPNLKYLGSWHSGLTDAGIEHLRGHPTFERIKLGPFWAERLTNRTLEHLAHCPAIRQIRLSETHLTWDDGLEQLLRVKEQLKEVDLANSLIEPADVATLRARMPGVTVKWGGLEAAGEVLRESGWHRGKISKWAPAALIDRAVAAAGGDGEGAAASDGGG